MYYNFIKGLTGSLKYTNISGKYTGQLAEVMREIKRSAAIYTYIINTASVALT